MYLANYASLYQNGLKHGANFVEIAVKSVLDYHSHGGLSAKLGNNSLSDCFIELW